MTTRPALRETLAEKFAGLPEELLLAANAAPHKEEGADVSDAASVFAHDLYKMFLRDLSRETLLSREQEIDAGKAVLAGGDAAKKGVETLVRGNIRLVISNAKRFTGHNVPFLDMIQEGCLGLIRAAQKFDYRKGYKFSTYATWWIRQAMTRAADNTGRTIRLPSHMLDKIRQLKTVQRQLTLKNGANPSHEELAQAMSLSLQQVEAILRAIRTEAFSYDILVGEEETCSFKELLADTESAGPVAQTTEHALSHDLEAALKTLSARERQVLTERFALGGKARKSLTLEQLGRRLGCSRERVRQLENNALQKLRRNTTHLKAYLE